jgi:hypothetical protein
MKPQKNQSPMDNCFSLIAELMKPQEKQSPMDNPKLVSPYLRSTTDLSRFVWLELNPTAHRDFDSQQHHPRYQSEERF